MKKAYALLLAVSLVVFQLVPTAVAQVDDSGQSLSRSYSADKNVPTGSVVALAEESGDNIVLANTSNADRTVGVVVQASESVLEINPGVNRPQVATGGIVRVLVSTAGGEIKSGDKVSVSALSGVAQKSYLGDYVVGFAKDDFTGAESGTQDVELIDESGKTRQFKAGLIEVQLSIGLENSLDSAENLNSTQELVKSITGNSTSMPRIIASIVIALLTLIGLSILLYASIYGSIISIGRNPLARASILRGLAVVLVMAGFGVVLALLLIYFLLR